MRLLYRISKYIMVITAILSGILLISENQYSNLACMCLLINVVVSAAIKVPAANENEERNYKYALALNALNGNVFEWNSKTKVLYTSDRFMRLLETKEPIADFQEFFEFIGNNDREYIKNFFNQIVKEKVLDDFDLQFEMITKNKKTVPVRCVGRGVFAQNLFKVSGILLDITDRVEQEKLLRDSEKKYRMAIDGSQDIMFCMDMDTKEITLSGKVSNLFKNIKQYEYTMTSEEWVSYIIEGDKDRYLSEFRKFIDSDSRYIKIEFRMELSPGNILWINQRGEKVTEDKLVHIYGSISNVTESKDKEKKIYYMNNFDSITDIPNKRYFTEKAKQILIKRKDSNLDLAIICMDIDNFSVINDINGHDMGDKLLKNFASTVKVMLNEKSTIARFGGNEFVILVDEVLYKGEVIKLLQKILNISTIPIKVDDKEFYCTISAGMSALSSDGDNIETLIKKADLAMYRAKSTGKNKYCIYNEEIENEYKRERILKRSLKDAIDKKEIFFEFQPKYWTEEGSIQGFECLSRWHHEEIGNVSPVEFIKVAEQSGMIVLLGRYLIDDAFKKAADIINYFGEKYKIAINLSELQIRDDELFQFIEKKLRQYKLNPNCIEFEVTEKDIMISPDKCIKNLRNIKELGVSISLDDFGKGYSSLNCLKKLPIDSVKLDKSFVDDIGVDKKNEYIIEKTIELAHLLNLRVVAEGVSNREQLNYLKENKCDIIQGYYYSKPKEFSQIVDMINSTK